MSLANSVIDFYDDVTGNVLRTRFPDVQTIPDFVKTAGRVDRNEHSNLFAVVMVDEGDVLKRFPTTDKGNTWLSTEYLDSCRAALPEEVVKMAAVNLKDAREYFGLPEVGWLTELAQSAGTPLSNVVDLFGLEAPTQLFVKTAGVEALNALTQAQVFVEDIHKISPKNRHEWAVNIVKVAGATGLIPDLVARYSGEDYGNQVDLGISARRELFSENPENLGLLEKVAALRTEVSASEFAETLTDFDRAAGISVYWDRIPDPYLTTFGMIKTAASAEEDKKQMQMGGMIPAAEIDTLLNHREQRVVGVFGPTFWHHFKQKPVAVLNSLPGPHRKILLSLAK